MQNQQFSLKGEFESKKVWMNGKKLHPSKSLKIENYSPDFNWGYIGFAPAQLALSVLLEIWTKERSIQWHKEFNRIVIQHVEGDFSVIVTISGTNFYLRKL